MHKISRKSLHIPTLPPTHPPTHPTTHPPTHTNAHTHIHTYPYTYIYEIISIKIPPTTQCHDVWEWVSLQYAATHCNSHEPTHSAPWHIWMGHSAARSNIHEPTLQHMQHAATHIRLHLSAASRTHEIHRITLQHAAKYMSLQLNVIYMNESYSNTLQLSATHESLHGNTLQYAATHVSVHFSAVTYMNDLHCSTLQHTTTHMSLHSNNVIKTATHCITLQHLWSYNSALRLVFVVPSGCWDRVSDLYLYATWKIHMSDVTHSHVTRLICMCDMTHLHD